MTPDELRALADAIVYRDSLAIARAADYLRAQADAQPERQPVSEAPGCWLFSNPEGTHKIEASSLGGLLSGIRSRFPDKCEPTEAQITAAAYERAAQQCLLIASGVEHYTQYYEACSDCADAIRALAAKESK